MRTYHTRRTIAAGLVAGVMLLALGWLPDARAGVKKSDSKVKVTAKATRPDDAGKQTVTVTFVIDKGWHIYANPVGNKDLAETQTSVTVAATGKPEVKVTYPPGKVIRDEVVGAYRVYEGKVSVQATVVRGKGDTSPLDVSVRFNACDDKGCLPPATLKFKLK
jgi:hypothetical protein